MTIFILCLILLLLSGKLAENGQKRSSEMNLGLFFFKSFQLKHITIHWRLYQIRKEVDRNKLQKKLHRSYSRRALKYMFFNNIKLVYESNRSRFSVAKYVLFLLKSAILKHYLDPYCRCRYLTLKNWCLNVLT